MSTTKDELPLGNPETFLGEVEHMDLGILQDQMFGVAVNTGPRDKTKYICESLRAPLNFFEMVEMVGNMWCGPELLHHKAFIISKDSNPKFLDECTIDYIEANYQNIVMNGFLGGELEKAKQFTCRAGFIVEKQDDEQQTPKPNSGP